jgi:hypothetical protein
MLVRKQYQPMHVKVLPDTECRLCEVVLLCDVEHRLILWPVTAVEDADAGGGAAKASGSKTVHLHSSDLTNWQHWVLLKEE